MEIRKLSLPKALVLLCITGILLTNCENRDAPTLPGGHEDLNTALQIQAFNPIDTVTTCDYLIITDRELLHPALCLAEYRRMSESDDVSEPRVLLTEAINPGFYQTSTDQQIQSIKKCIHALETSWKNHPRYVVLFGDDQTSNHNSAGIPIPDSSLYADLYYADVDTNKSPDVILGRITVSSEYEGDNYVAKVKAFESSPPQNILTIADDRFQLIYNNILPFDNMAQKLISYLDTIPDFNLSTSGYFLSDFSSADTLPLNKTQITTAKNALLDSLNNGSKIVTFYGHTNQAILTDEQVFTIDDISKLHSLNLWVSLGCNSNHYGMENSIARQLLCLPQAGAVAFIGPYSISYASRGEKFIFDFHRALFETNQKRSAGRAFFSAWNQQSWKSTASGYFAFLGDPALIVRP